MNAFNRFMERFLVPVASRMNAQRHVAAVRDSFMLLFPLTMAASLVILINNLVFSTDGLVAKLLFLPKLFPNLESAQQVLSPVAHGTLDLMSIFLAFSVAYTLANHFKADALLAGMTSIACFIILYPPPFISEEQGVMAMETTYLGAQGLFVAMFVGCLIGEFLPKLFANEKLKIRMPDMVPPAVSRSFSGLIPIVLVVMCFAIISSALAYFVPGGVNQLIYTSIQAPLKNIGSNVFGVLLIAFVQELLWIVGIHGPNTLAPIRAAIFTEPGLENLSHVNAHGLVGVPYPETFELLNDAFGNMGGSGMTLGLIIAIFIASKRKEQRDIAKMSLAPGLFNINEPVIFGLPIVLNPILMIPFILVPLVNITIGYVATVVIKIIPPAAISVPWTTPGPLIAFLGTGGNLLALAIGFLCLGVSVLIYLPFVIAGNKVRSQ